MGVFPLFLETPICFGAVLALTMSRPSQQLRPLLEPSACIPRWFGDQKMTCLASPLESLRSLKGFKAHPTDPFPQLWYIYIYIGYDGSKFRWVAQNEVRQHSLVSYIFLLELCHFQESFGAENLDTSPLHCWSVSRGSPWICHRWSWWPDWCFAKATGSKSKCPNHQRTCMSTHQNIPTYNTIHEFFLQLNNFHSNNYKNYSKCFQV